MQRTLKRLLDGDEDIASKPSGPGAKPSLSEEEDLLVGLLATKGFSQPMALQLLNLERFEKGLEPVSLRSLQRAEARVQLMRRKRRSRKAGSTDLKEPGQRQASIRACSLTCSSLLDMKLSNMRRGEATHHRPGPRSSTGQLSRWEASVSRRVPQILGA